MTMDVEWTEGCAVVTEDRTLHCSCLCNAVAWELQSVLRAQCCHCSICRKVSGSPYLHNIIVSPSGFVVTKGEAHTFKYASSREIERVRCRTCGSYLWAVSNTFERVYAVPIGVVDDACEPNGDLKEILRPQHHICYGDKLCSVRDGTPKFRSLPGGERVED